MRKRILSTGIFLLVSGLLSLTFSACGNSKGAPVRPLTFDQVSVDTIVALAPQDDRSPHAHLKLVLLYAKGDNAQIVNDSIIGSKAFQCDLVKRPLKRQSPQKTLKTFVKEYIRQYRRECDPIYTQDRTIKSLNYEFMSIGQLVDHGDTACLLFRKYVYTGGANGLSTTLAMNIDKKTGQEIGKEEFLKSVSEDRVRDLIVENLARQLQVRGIEGLHDMGVFSDTAVYVPDNFILGKDSVTFLYGTEEIAPHYLGEMKVTVPWKEMKDESHP